MHFYYFLFEVFEIPVELANFPNLLTISAKLKKKLDAKWSPILVFSLALIA